VPPTARIDGHGHEQFTASSAAKWVSKAKPAVQSESKRHPFQTGGSGVRLPNYGVTLFGNLFAAVFVSKYVMTR